MRSFAAVLFVAAAVIAVAARAEVYFNEKFDDGEKWTSRWTESEYKGKDAGKVGLSAGKWHVDEAKETGLQTQENSKFYMLTAPMLKSFSNKGKTLVIQYTLKQDQHIDCGGGYLKFLPKDSFEDPKKFTDTSKYNIMFGPDICGSTRKTHLIFRDQDKNENHLIKKTIKAETDDLTHQYTLFVFPNNTYEVQIDAVKVESGSLEDDWDMVAPKMIDDPKESKPKDWVDAKEIDDPEDKKPANWDDIPARIVDPEAKKPDDWDDDTDGEWEAPTIANPEYKGEWHAKRIPNPAYKGEWVHPQIANPAYKANPELYAFPDFSYVAIDVWQVKSGSIFDNILVTDDAAVAKDASDKFMATRQAEKDAKKAYDDAEAAKKKAEEDAKKAEEAAKPKEETKEAEKKEEKAAEAEKKADEKEEL